MSRYEGEYAPNDQRDVTLKAGEGSIEPDRTGPEVEAMRDDESSDGAQVSYGNSRTADGTMEQDLATENLGNRQAAADQVIVGETSDRPDVRAYADANPTVQSA